MLNGNSAFAAPAQTDHSWYRWRSPTFGLLLRMPMWIGGTAVFAFAFAYVGVPPILELMSWVSSIEWQKGSCIAAGIDATHEWLSSLSLTERFAGVLFVSASVVLTTGMVRRALEEKL